MLLIDLMEQTKDVLQDTDSNYWSESELVDYYNSGVRALAAERKEKQSSITVALYESTNEYEIDGVLRYISAKDSNGMDRVLYQDDTTGDDDTYGIIILDYNKIYVNNPADNITLTIKNVAMPEHQNLDDTVRLGDENAMEYFMVSKAYKKESDMENFQKSEYFMSLYKIEEKNLTKDSKAGYVTKTQKTEGYYY